jgi:uncharacterized protein
MPVARRIVRRQPRARKARDPLAQLLASGALRSVVLYFLTHREDAPTVRGLARATGLGPGSLGREINRLFNLGLLDRRGDAREVRLALRRREPVWAALESLARAATAPVDLLRAALADLPGVSDAFVFGSFARGDAHAGSDVDLCVVGTPDERALARRTIDAGVLLGRDVNVVLLDPDAWERRRASARPFDRELTAGPRAWVIRGRRPVRPGLSGETVGGVVR